MLSPRNSKSTTKRQLADQTNYYWTERTLVIIEWKNKQELPVFSNLYSSGWGIRSWQPGSLTPRRLWNRLTSAGEKCGPMNVCSSKDVILPFESWAFGTNTCWNSCCSKTSASKTFTCEAFTPAVSASEAFVLKQLNLKSAHLHCVHLFWNTSSTLPH